MSFLTSTFFCELLCIAEKNFNECQIVTHKILIPYGMILLKLDHISVDDIYVIKYIQF